MREALYQFINSQYTEMIAIFPIVLLLIGLYIAVRIDPYIRRQERRIMLVILTLVFSLVAENYLDHLLTVKWTFVMLRKIVDIYGYSVRPVILLLFLHIVSKRKPGRGYWILISANAVIHLTALFSDICFTIGPENDYQGGFPVLKNSCLITSTFLLVMLLYTMLRDYRLWHHKEILVPIFAVMSILIALALDYSAADTPQPVTFLTISIVISSVLYYIWLHFQFVREHEDDLEAQQRIQIMMTQIQPHFLYNTLATIRSLCLRSPETAARTIDKFSRYLRQNLDALDSTGLIPFGRELEHVRIYTEIEMLMFPYIDIRYSVEDEDFMMPVLTLQPLVENAIRHGVRACESGLIDIAVRRKEDGHIITITDNGVGFDPAAAYSGEGKHIGIRNVSERLEKQCGGLLKIVSRPGYGTEVTIFIPDADQSAGSVF